MQSGQGRISDEASRGGRERLTVRKAVVVDGVLFEGEEERDVVGEEQGREREPSRLLYLLPSALETRR